MATTDSSFGPFNSAGQEPDGREDFYLSLLQGIDSPIGVIDAEGVYYFANAALEQRFGLPAVEIIGRRIQDFMPPAETATRVDAIRHVIERQAAEVGEWTTGSGEGQRFYRTLIQPLPAVPGRPALALVHSLDITAQRRAEQQAAETNAWRQAMFAHSLNGILLVDADSGEILSANPEACRLLGYSEAELCTMHRSEIGDQSDPRLAAAFAERDRTGKFRGELTFIRADGAHFPVEIANSLFADPDGRTVSTTFFWDISERKQAEEALHENEEKWRSLVEFLPFGVSIVSADNQVVESNPALAQILDLTPAELSSGAYARRRYLRADRTPMPAEEFPSYRATHEQRMIRDVEVGIEKEDGALIWTSVSATPMPFHGQTATATVNITERKRAEEALRASEERLRLALDASSEGWWDWNIATGEVICNDRWFTLLGFTPGEIEPLFRYWQESLHPEDAGATLQILDDYLQGRAPTYYTEHRAILKSGETRWHLSVGKVVAWDDGGRPLRMVGTNVDITERKQAEAALAASEAQLRAVIENVGGSVWSVDRSYRLLVANSAFDQLVTQQIGRPLALGESVLNPFFPPESNAFWRPLYDRALAGENVTVETASRLRPGRILEAQLNPIRDTDGAVIGATGASVDITERKQQQETLAASQAMYRLLAENSSDAVSLVDAEGKVVYSSPANARRLGYDEQELESLHIGDILAMIHPEDRGRIAAEIQRGRELGLPVSHYEYRLRTKNGDYLWLEDYSRREFDQNGQPVRTVVNSRDITARKQAELALRAGEERYRRLVETSQQGIWELDDQACTTFVNEPLAKMLGYSAAEMQGISLFDFIDPADRDEVAQRFEKRRRGFVEQFDCHFRRKDGQHVWGLLSTVPIFDGTGEFAGGIATIVDITERKVQSNRELAQREKIYSALLDSLSDAVLLITPDGRLRRANRSAADLLGYALDELPGLNIAQICAPEENWQRRLDIEALLSRGGQGSVTEVTLVTHEGDRLTVEANATVVEDPTGDVLLQVVAHDITLRKQSEDLLRHGQETLELANQELARALRLKDEFLANMSHELRTPLTGIMGLSESMEERIAGPLTPKQEQYIHVIRESGDHLLALINDILDLSKIGAGSLTLDKQWVPVDALCQSCLRMVREIANKKRLKVGLALDSSVTAIWGDDRRLKQMLVNLLSNAVKFTSAGGEIGLSVRGQPDDQQVTLTVWDTGIGIAAEDLPKLFQPFVQVQTGLARESGGTGLGLALVAQMARLHGGRVDVESTPGQGSRFIITLPWNPADKPAAATDTAAPLPRQRVDPTNVGKQLLLVEDTAENAATVTDFLETVGYQVVVAGNGSSAIRLAQQLHPALILMDIQMPGMSGLEATRIIKSDPDLARIPIIGVTALAMEYDRERCLAAGMIDYISKPFSLKNLVRAIEQHLAGAEKPGR